MGVAFAEKPAFRADSHSHCCFPCLGARDATGINEDEDGMEGLEEERMLRISNPVPSAPGASRAAARRVKAGMGRGAG